MAESVMDLNEFVIICNSGTANELFATNHYNAMDGIHL